MTKLRNTLGQSALKCSMVTMKNSYSTVAFLGCSQHQSKNGIFSVCSVIIKVSIVSFCDIEIEICIIVGDSGKLNIDIPIPHFIFLGGVCECNACFMVDPGSSTCFTCSDFMYDPASGSCGTDFRQDQRRAFVLSFFLSSTGAANFYIESYGLGKNKIYMAADYYYYFLMQLWDS